MGLGLGWDIGKRQHGSTQELDEVLAEEEDDEEPDTRAEDTPGELSDVAPSSSTNTR